MARNRDADEHVIRQDGYDLAAYAQASEDLPELRAVERDGEARDPAFRSLVEDIHASLYKPTVTLDPGGAAHPLHEGILAEMIATTEYEKLRATTILNDAAAAFGTTELAQRIVEKLPHARKPRTGTPIMPSEMTLIGTKDRDEMRRSLRAMLTEAREATEDAIETMAAVGWGTGGTGASTTDVRDVAALTTRIKRSRILKDIMLLAGRMRRMALRKHADRVKHGPDELVDIEVGRDLARALPSEIAMLAAGPELRLDFLARFAEGQVLQYRMDGREKLGRGPIVVCIDTSGSMRGQREVWSKALALGMLAIAIHEKRPFAVVLFSDRGQAKMYEFSGSKATHETCLACLEHFYGNGTDFVTPLDLALGLCQQSKLDKADIVFITDGECHVDPVWGDAYTKKREARGTKLYSIIIGTQSPTMTWLSDGVAHIHDLSADAEATDLAFGSM